jgi:hypothetical protein
MTNETALQRRIRFLLVLFMCALAMSGLTAIPLQWELRLLVSIVTKAAQLGINVPALSQWIARIYNGVQNGYGQYPFLAYGTDWLAFGHVAIALAFIGPLRDPVKNIWVIEFGMIACLLVIPWTMIFGAVREIPFFWQLIDMSFGIFGIIPLWLARQSILKLTQEL